MNALWTEYFQSLVGMVGLSNITLGWHEKTLLSTAKKIIIIKMIIMYTHSLLILNWVFTKFVDIQHNCTREISLLLFPVFPASVLVFILGL